MYKLNLLFFKKKGFNESNILKSTKYISNLMITNSLTIESVIYLGKKELLISSINSSMEAYLATITFQVPINFYKNKILNYIARNLKLNLKVDKFFIEKNVF